MSTTTRLPWFVRGDIDGFFGLAVDNLVQLLVIVAFCSNPFLLGLPDAIVYGRILPGAAVSLLIGNLFYAWQARRLAARTGAMQHCALPYGINTPSVFLYIFLVMLPAKMAAESQALAAGLDAEAAAARAATVAWQVGLLACLGSGLIELGGSLVAERIRRATPRAALLATLAGIALGFISMPFLFQAYTDPIVALLPLVVIFLVYFGRVRFRWGLPGGLVAIVLGTVLAWCIGFEREPVTGVGFHPPVPVFGDLYAALGREGLGAYISVILAMGIFNVVGSLQNIESAEAAGDPYPTGPALAMNGLGTCAAACFGSCFPTTIYIGHPGWKALGARAGYSVANALFFTVICCSGAIAAIGWLIPQEAVIAIVVWIAIVITAQCFQATPRAHAPAVVVGLLPGIAAWGALMLKHGLRAAGVGTSGPGGPVFSPELETSPAFVDNHLVGALHLEQGVLFTSMILAAATVGVIQRRWSVAAVWMFIAAGLAAVGLMHGYAYTPGDVVLHLHAPGEGAWQFAVAYAICGLFLLVVPFITTPRPDLPGAVAIAAADDADETRSGGGETITSGDPPVPARDDPGATGATGA